MMDTLHLISDELDRLRNTKTYKYETALEGPQGGVVKVSGKKVVMLASNNYLGLSNHPAIKRAAAKGIKEYGYGLASVRFLCGTQTIHRALEQKIARFLRCEDSILYSSCFSANEGFFAAIVNEKLGMEVYKDVLYSDRLNHASIIDGQRLCRPELVDKKIYQHADMADLERLLEEGRDKDYRFRIIATDGVFSMEGDLAPLDRIAALARRFGAMLFVDDSHGVGVCGKSGRGAPEAKNALGKIDVLTGTLGKAIGGAAGGYICGTEAMISYLRQKSRPYTFSNSLPPSNVYGAMAAFDLLNRDRSIVGRLHRNTLYFRKEVKSLGFTIIEGEHPIVPIMLGDAAVAQDMSAALLKAGVYIKGLWFPVVPKGEARLRAQVSADHTTRNLDRALEALESVGRKMRVI
ncbi:MAG: glycine C-acetyltransferase [Ignavibacteria bacterium]|nr:MAG: glycine C-acetyltransferase [Ignavibacteria bacterium]